ncbi:MAG: dTDP-4-dehydrorhamnose reductase [Clostridiales bacterium]|jgi:dTDP-4-dehydrorhamnose reductase|nr:dTDP-4-dehydrorhamnose reductase [Clostridiales bacterium]
MKVLLTGAKGMLGTDMAAVLGQKHDVTGIDIADLDITNLDDTLKFVKNIKPDVIINPAAFTQVDMCETEADTAYRVNSIGARNMAIAANEVNSPIIHISTDYVFDGNSKIPYTEFDTPNPQSVYGKSKLAGENYVKSMTNKYFIFRIQWLYGKNGPNFVKTILRIAKEKGRVTVVNDQIGKPTYTKDVAAAVLSFLGKGDYGTYHVTNSGIVSWYEFTAEILKQSGLKNVELLPCTTAEFPRPAKRPAYAPLDNYCLRLLGYAQMRPFEEALGDYLTETGEVS